MLSKLLTNKRLVKRLLFYCARWNLYRPAAHLLNQCTTVVKKGDPSKGPIKRVLVMNWVKDGVLADVKYTFMHDDTFEVIIWPIFTLQNFSSALLEPGLYHDKYVTSNPAVEKSKERYRNFLANVWKCYNALKPVSAVLAVNFGYFQQREFATAVEREGAPFIVLQRENYNGVPHLVDFWSSVYSDGRGKFTGRKILVYNDIERQLEISTGIVGPESVIVTGVPRLDAIHRWRCEQAAKTGVEPEQPQVLFFTFAPNHKIPRFFGKCGGYGSLPETDRTVQAVKELERTWEGRDWKQLCVETHEAILEFARARPDVQVVVKSKKVADQTSIADKLLNGDGEPPPNLKIVYGGDPFKLLADSSVVIGFNTTALFEALAAGKPVIVPRFAEARKKEMEDIILDLGSAVEHASSPRELIDLISKNVARPTKVPLNLSANASKALRQYTGNDDGLAGKRVLDAISAEIQSN